MAWHLHGFPGGIHPARMNKSPAVDNPIETLLLPPHLILPLHQHSGEPAIPVVEVGQKVRRGQLIAKAAPGRSAAVHAPANGEISFIGFHACPNDSGMHEQCIGICTDEEGELDEDEFVDDISLTEEEMRQRIAMAGIVGLGGAGFPTVKKLTRHGTKYLIINAAECEPYISCDDRLMRERAPQIVEGIHILARLLQAEKILFAIEDNKPEALKEISLACFETDIEVVVIPTKYPSGAQKQLVQNLLGIEVPSGQHSTSLGIVMYNVGTCYAVSRAIAHSEPLISRIVTVTGDAVQRPGNYEVLVGTPIEYLLQHAGVHSDKLRRVVMGGPIMGIAINNLSAPVTKLTNCLIASGPDELDEDLRARECIRCGDCVEACPASLLPQQLYWHIKTGAYERAEKLHLDDCIECGACAYVCPSHIPLVQYYRHGKSHLWLRQQERQKAEHAKQRFDARQARLDREKEEKVLRHKRAAEARLAAAQASEARATETQPAAKAEPDKPVIEQHNDRMSEVLAAVERARKKKTDPDAENKS